MIKSHAKRGSKEDKRKINRISSQDSNQTGGCCGELCTHRVIFKTKPRFGICVLVVYEVVLLGGSAAFASDVKLIIGFFSSQESMF